MPRTIVLADLRVIALRYELVPEPRVFVTFQFLDEKSRPLERLQFSRWFKLSEAEIARFEQFIRKNILPRVRQAEGLADE